MAVKIRGLNAGKLYVFILAGKVLAQMWKYIFSGVSMAHDFLLSFYVMSDVGVLKVRWTKALSFRPVNESATLLAAGKKEDMEKKYGMNYAPKGKLVCDHSDQPVLYA